MFLSAPLPRDICLYCKHKIHAISIVELAPNGACRWPKTSIAKRCFCISWLNTPTRLSLCKNIALQHYLLVPPRSSYGSLVDGTHTRNQTNCVQKPVVSNHTRGLVLVPTSKQSALCIHTLEHRHFIIIYYTRTSATQVVGATGAPSRPHTLETCGGAISVRI